MRSHLSRPRRLRRGASLFLASLSACVLTATGAAASLRWFPEASPYLRPLADPLEPRTSITYASSRDRVDATLGRPIPVLAFGPADRPLVATLEAHAFFRLGRDRAFFPLQTFDGIFGASLERRVRWGAARLSLAHWSAHRADGDSAVAYRGMTFSREFWNFDLQRQWAGGMVYAGLGTSWHAVPVDHGLALRLGAQRSWGGGSWRPFAAVHFAADAARRMRVAQTGLLGFETGHREVFRLALRGFAGPRSQGQYWRDVERYVGADISFGP
jgi:hypothetical protein